MEVKDLLAYLQLADNPNYTVSDHGWDKLTPACFQSCRQCTLSYSRSYCT